MEALKDPCNDRAVKNQAAPPSLPLSEELLYPDGNRKKPDVDQLRKHLLREGTLKKETLLDLIGRVQDVYRAEPTLVGVQAGADAGRGIGVRLKNLNKI